MTYEIVMTGDGDLVAVERVDGLMTRAWPISNPHEATLDDDMGIKTYLDAQPPGETEYEARLLIMAG